VAVTIDLAHIARLVARWWVLLVLGLVVGGGAGYAAVRNVPSVYQSSITLQVTRPAEAPATDPLLVQSVIRTYAELVRTQPILSQAAAKAGIAVPARELQGSVSAGSVRDTQLLRITVEDTDRDGAAALATALADVLTARIDETQASRFAASTTSIGRLIESLRTAVEDREARAIRMRAEPSSPAHDVELAALDAELQEARGSYASAIRAQADLRLLQARSGESLAIVEPAQVPDRPIRPSRTRAVGLGMLGGFTVALAIVAAALLLEARRARSAAPVAKANLPVLAEVSGGDTTADALRSGWVSESYRGLPGRIASQGFAARSILVTSAGPLEGTSRVAAGFAVALARAGWSVVLVDANLREPTQAARFGVPSGAGLSTLLFAPDKPCQAALRQTAVDGLRVMPAGPAPSDPAAFLREHSIRDRLADLYSGADIVVVDAPAISAGPDAFLVGLDTDAALLVVDADEPIGTSTDLAGLMTSCGIRPLGAVRLGTPGQKHRAATAHERTGARADLTLTKSGGKAWSPPLSRA
jgi:non-specific protein-tyrosine kinase